jgi:transcriptional antiterminator RfaH
MLLQKDELRMMHWHILHSKHRNDDLLCRQLYSRDIEFYYPRLKAQLDNSHHRKAKPYFPGYVFTHVDLDVLGLSILQWIPGAVGLVSFGGEPAWISDSIVNSIRHQVDQINCEHTRILNTFKKGDDISIHSGPFAGHHGIFDSYLSDSERVIVFLKFVRDQQIRVELPMGQIENIKKL